MPSLDSLITFLQALLSTLRGGHLPELGYWTYAVFFVLVAFEGTFAILLGAAAASTGLMRPVPVFFTAAAGNLTADCLWYLLGYFGKTEWIFHFGRRLGVQLQTIERLRRALTQHATKVMFLAKVTSSLVIPALVTAGLLRIPFRRWFPYFIISETLWTGALVLIGYYTAESLRQVQQGIHYILLGVALVFVVFMLVAGRRLLRSLNANGVEATSE